MSSQIRYPRFWTCSISDCSRAAAIDIGNCEWCMRHFCAVHVDSTLHTCEKEPLDDAAWTAAQTEELTSLRRRVSDESLLRHASELNRGTKCWLDDADPLGRSLMGGIHIHLRIRFADGSAWLARILRHNFTSFSDELSNNILLSECATLKWFETVGVPVPGLHDYGLRNDPRNEVGVAYMLIDELPGKPLSQLNPTEQQIQKVYSGLADILCTLSEHPFDQIGSLTLNPHGDIHIGPVTGDRTGTLAQIGPFRDATRYYVAWAEEYLRLIADGQLFLRYSVNAYLVFKYLAELAGEGKFNGFEGNLNNSPFFLKHMDDKGDHILVDESFVITGIIDWSFARVVPAYEAFGPSLVTADMDDIFTGRARLSEHDRLLAQALQAKGSPLTRFAQSTDKIRRLTFALGMGMNLSWDEALDVFKGIMATVSDSDADFEWEKWRKDRMVQWADDKELTVLTQGLEGKQSIAESGKLSFASNEVPRFATCSFVDCARPAVRGLSCARCRKHLCARHQSRQFHTCPSNSELDDEAWERAVNDEVLELVTQINVQELVKLATALNGGKSCKFQTGKHLGIGAIMGCANYHGWIIFDDGEEWLIRIPRTGFSDVPMDLVEYLVASEYATLKFLESTKVPAPKTFGFGLASDPMNRVGVNYLLIQALPGKPYYPHNATVAQKRRVLGQLADVLIELSKHPLQKAGSLLLRDGKIDVSAVASNRFVSLGRYGPFDNPSDYFINIAEQYLDLIPDGQIYHEYPREAFLFYRTLRQHAMDLCVNESPSVFYMKHVDDKGDHLLIDEDYNITGIIDWQFARSVPACEAFGPSLVTANLNALYSSNAGVTDDDKFLAQELRARGSEDLANYAEESESVRRFHHGLASGLTRDEVCDMLRGMLATPRAAQIVDIDRWIIEEWNKCRSDHRWRKIEALAQGNKQA